MKARVAIACGGTGGHLYPGIAVADELARGGHEPLLLVSNKQIDALALKGCPHKSVPLPAIGWPGLGLRAPVFAWKLAAALLKCRTLFRSWTPSAVLGMGGFTSAVPLWLAARAGVPGFIHDSNAVPGRATRMLAPRLKAVLLGFGAAGERLKGRAARTVVTGTPVRYAHPLITREAALAALGLDPARRTLAVMGGSQGARAINDAILRALPLWEGRRGTWQVVHLTGPGDAARVEAGYGAARLPARVMEFSHAMDAVYAACDVAVARAGAGTLAELAAFGVPSILIPYPFAADNHQQANAEVFERAGAAVVMEQARLERDLLGPMVDRLMDDTAGRQRLREAAYDLAAPDAAARVAAAVLEAVKA